MAKLNKTPLTIRAKRGTEAEITSYTGYQLSGEIAYATDTETFFVSNGTTFVPVGGGTLQSITDEGNSTTNSISIGGDVNLDVNSEIVQDFDINDPTLSHPVGAMKLYRYTQGESNVTTALKIYNVDDGKGVSLYKYANINYFAFGNETGARNYTLLGDAISAWRISAPGSGGDFLINGASATGQYGSSMIVRTYDYNVSSATTNDHSIIFQGPDVTGTTDKSLVSFQANRVEVVGIKHDGTIESKSLNVDGNVLIENNLHVKGDVTIGKISNDSALVDVGGNFNFDTVSEPGASDTANFTATIQNVAGNIDNGSHTYHVIYKTADGGETGAYNSTYFKTITITDNTTAGQVLLTGIPVSTDERVVARDIYRTSANDSPYYGKKLATINDNTTTTYTDNLPDSSLDQNTLFYRKADTTAGVFYIDNQVIAQAPNAHRTSFGQGALRNNTIGQDNVAIGGNSLSAITNGKQNTAIGYSSGVNSVDGQNNTFLGYVAGYYNDSGDWNTYVGSFAGRNNNLSTTNYNTGVGGGSLYKLTTNNSWNTGLGYYSGNGAQGQWNLHLGYYAGYKSTPTSVGSFNINIGAYTGQLTTGSGNILIGRQIDAHYASSSNQLNIGNLIYGDGLGNSTNPATGNVGISSATPSSKLSINGTALEQFRLETKGAPSGVSDTNGNEGDFAFDDNYLYIKTANGWGRTQLDFGW